MTSLTVSPHEKELLKNSNIEALILFGSQAQGIPGTMSDYDFGVLLSKHSLLHQQAERKRLYDFLYEFLSSKIQRLVNIDIVFLDDAPLELKSHVAHYGICLYERSPIAFANFRENVIGQYADFAPIRRIFNEAILSRIPS